MDSSSAAVTCVVTRVAAYVTIEDVFAYLIRTQARLEELLFRGLLLPLARGAEQTHQPLGQHTV